MSNSDDPIRPNELATLVDALSRHAGERPEERAFTFLRDGEEAEATITFGELDRRARGLAGWLAAESAPGDRALLVYPPGLGFVEALFGCLYSGLVAVPCPLPRTQRDLPRVQAIAADCGAALALTTVAALPKCNQLVGPGFAPFRWLATDGAELGGAGELVAAAPEDLALLQYTSGSTARPKGVMVRHRNLLANVAAIAYTAQTGVETVAVSWLPHFHDMGLIGLILHAVFAGFHGVLMAPTAFLKRPSRWLRAISGYAATYSGGPDFGFDLCVRQVSTGDVKGLDLRSWQAAFSGAEPVRQATLERFAAKFASCGFRRSAFVACYGLAEATLLVAAGELGGGAPARRFSARGLEVGRLETVPADDPGRELVGCGKAAPGVEVAIVDPETGAPRAAGEIGEIWTSGPGVAAGYWNLPAESDASFRARLTGGAGGEWLRTGDLGFLSGGELFVTGRLKDLIILAGRNLSPQDLELSAERSHPELVPHGGAAFAVESGERERVILVQEVARGASTPPAELIQAIRRQVAEDHDVSLDAVVLLHQGRIPRTTSGKIQRAECRRQVLAGGLEVVARWERAAGSSQEEPAGSAARLQAVPVARSSARSRDEIAAWLSARLAERIGLPADELDPRKPYAYFGLRSADVAGIAADLESWLDLRLPAELLWGHPSPAELADGIATYLSEEVQRPASSVAEPPVATVSEITADVRDVAIIGLGCRFPGADSPEAFWDLLCQGRDVGGDVPPARRDLGTGVDGFDGALGATARGFFLPGIDRFDRHLFGLSAVEAEAMDPQHRLLLEVVWETVEQAGYRPEILAGLRTGVFVAAAPPAYGRLAARQGGEGGLERLAGNLGCMAANRISYTFDWTGPSLTVDAACSSSLVALDLARRQLSAGEIDAAVVGGVNLILDPGGSPVLAASGLLSPEGRCRVFDEGASGFVRGEGVAAVLLKPLVAARRDGDQVWAVIRGSAINHDGRCKLGPMTPSVRAQRRLGEALFADTGVDPSTVGLIEAHAAGTPLGDSLEVRALSQAFGAHTRRRGFCALGAVKGNLGHGEAVSGLAGLLKAALALSHGALPPTLHLKRPNRNIGFEETPFFVNDRLRPWPAGEHPRRAVVGASGIGGTNVQVLLEEPPPAAAAERRSDRSCHLLVLSALTPARLKGLVCAYRRFLARYEAVDLADLCFTAAAGRRGMPCRLALVARDREQLADRLSLVAVMPGWEGVESLEDSSVFYGHLGDDAGEGLGAATAAVAKLGEEARRVVTRCCCGRRMQRYVLPYLPALSEGEDPPAGRLSRGDRSALLLALARLWVRGVEVDWEGLEAGEPRRRVRLPGAQFERERFWAPLAPSVAPRPPAGLADDTRQLGPAAPPPMAAEPCAPGLPASPQERLEAWLSQLVAAAVGRPPAALDADANFHELGLDSIAAIKLIQGVERQLGVRLSPLEVFEHSRISDLAALLESRLDAVPALLRPLLDAANGRGEALAAAVEEESPEPFPCVELQVAFLMARELPAHLGGRGCRIYCETRIREALDVPRLQEAFQGLIRRHSILRTVFPGGGRQQVLSAVPEYEIRCDDLRGLPAAAAEARCLEVRQALSRSNPPPDRWPLFQVQLCRTGEEEYRLFLATDMLQGDFLSLLIMVRDWRHLYREPQVALPSLGTSFRQYVAHLEELRASPGYAVDRAYWLERLEEIPPPPRLPIRRDAASAARPDFASCGHRFAPAVWERLKGLARSHQVTASAMVATLYGQVLAEWSGEGRFVLNLPVFNRHGAGAVEAMMGPFATNVLLAVDLAAGVPFWEQVERLHLRTLETLEHRLFSGVELSRALIEHRRCGLAPVAPVVLTSALYEGELWGELELALSQTAMVWLDCIFFEDRGSLRLFWDYVEDLFDRADLERRFRRLADLLERLARDGDLPVEPLVEPLADAEPVLWQELLETDRRLILAVNDTAAPHPDTTLTALIAEQAARTPESPAILAIERTVSYRQLEEESNRVANALLARGVAPDSRVALALGRGADAIVAAVGIQKAGAGYVPIDPDYPEARRRAMLEVCQPAAVLTSPEVLAAGSDLQELPTVLIAGGEVANASPLPPARRVTPENLAYVIFTSGSTGRPKGAMLTHRNAVNTLYHSVRLFRVIPQDRLLGFSSLSFDMSVWDVFGALLAGAAVVTLAPGESREPKHWLELLRRHQVTIWNSVPTGMKLLLDFWEGRGAEGTCPLRLALLGGDWIPLNLPDRIRQFFPGAEVISVGGPTECCLWQNYFPVGEVDPAWRSIPYGKPMANHRMLLLDDRLSAVPVGEVGEIVYAGAGVGLGYVNDPERTAGAFTFHPALRQRIYRSGDLGRYLPDGNVEIVGRRDHQVKIRGYRVELGEIDAALQAHDAIDASAAVAWPDAVKGNQLAAFYATRRPVAAAELRAHLALRLPAYMLPAKLEELPALPLNANGKIDRRELIRRLAEGPGPKAERQPGTGEPAPAGEPERLQAVRFGELGRLLGALRQLEVRGKPKYLWPSGGGLYPVQTYLRAHSGRVAGLEGGIYYHHPVRHALVRLGAEVGPAGDEAFTVFLVGELDAVEPMYGDKARDLCQFEAGSMAHLLSETAAGLELELTPAAGMAEDEVRRLLGLRGSQILFQELRGGRARAVAATAPDARPLALPRPAVSAAAPVALPPATGRRPDTAEAIEERLLALWRELFQMEHLHADDHFFEIGGNSQLAVLAIRRAGEELGLEIQVADLFSYPTLRALSAHLAGQAAAAPAVLAGRPAPPPAPRNPYAGLPLPKGVRLVTAEEREGFKNRQEGIRRDLDGASSVELEAGPLEALRARCSQRRSWRRYAPGPLDAAQLQGLLAGCLTAAGPGGLLLPVRPGTDRRPLQVYLHVKPGRVSGLDGGIYLLDGVGHKLVAVSAESERVAAHLHFPHNRRLFGDAAFSLFVVAELGAVEAPTLKRARELCLAAIGAWGRRIETAAILAGVGLCHIGMMNVEPLRDVLGLGEERRVFLHSLLGGALGPQEIAEGEEDARTLRDPRQAGREGLQAVAAAGAPEPAAPPPAAARRSPIGEGSYRPGAVAVIGMAGRFPQAADLDAYWRLLREGVEVVREVPPERWDVASHFDADVDKAGATYSRWGSFLADLEGFDPLFFHLSPTEARAMDPQQRLLLTLAWEAFEAAGYAGGQLAGSRTGVFIGASHVHHRESYAGLPQDAYMGLGTQPALLANRLSYFLDLHGPSLTLDTLCSSSLVALHLACRSLRDGDCDLALAGGVHMGMTPGYFEGLSRLGAFSPTGHCYTFDRRADGIVCGEGAGVVLLKRLDQAVADRDHVVGILRGTAVNHGGRAAGLTVPNALAQAELVRSALADAEVSADSIGLLEAHGTGTSLGDPIEIDGLNRAFRADTLRSQFCAIGSAKTNLGHLDSAAGIAGLLKVLLALRAAELPPTLNLRAPNPAISFETAPFYVNDRLRPWPRNGEPRRAGVSAFGMGGANAHVIVEEPPPVADGPRRERDGHLLTLSARSSPALERLARRLEGCLASAGGVSLGDLCFTANTGRAPLLHRLAVTGRDRAELREGLGRFLTGEACPAVHAGQAQRRGEVRIAMLFTGQGAQRPGMGRELFATQPAFRQALERSAALFDPYLEVPLLSVLFPSPGSETLIHETAYAQPALFALEVALTELWRTWGIVPAAVLGHSIGELAAACVAGVFSLEDGARLVAERGRRMQSLSNSGKMAVVAAGEGPIDEALAPYHGRVSIAALNGPENTVVSGEAAAVDALLADLDGSGIRSQGLQVSHAFHSPLMEPILDGFEVVAAGISYRAPSIPLVSNLSGRLLAAGEVPDAAYWRRHVREAVRFAAGIEALTAAGYDLLLEVGPAPVLTGMARRLVPEGVCRLASLRSGSSEWAALLGSLGALFVQGAAVDWAGVESGFERRRVPLPTYPFENVRCALDASPAAALPPPRPVASPAARHPRHPLLGERVEGADATGTICFDRTLSLADEPLVADHRILGNGVLAGVVQLDLLLAAFQAVHGAGPASVRDLSFREALTVAGSAGPVVLRAELRPDGEGFAGRVLSRRRQARDDGPAAWTEHCRGRFASLSSPAPVGPAPAELAASLGEEVAGEAFYRQATDLGVVHGPAFRALLGLRQGEGQVLARLRSLAPAGRHVIDPGVLDGAFQAGMALIVSGGGERAGLYLPVRVGEVRVHESPASALWAWVRAAGESGSATDELRADIALLDLDGRVAVELAGVCARKVRGAGEPAPASGPAVPGQWLQQVRWRELPPAAARPIPAGSWLVWLDDQGVGEALCRRLEGAGRQCLRVVSAPGFAVRPDGVFTVDPARSEEMARLIGAVDEAAPDLAGIVHLVRATAGEDEPETPAQLQERLADGVWSLFRLVRGVASRRRPGLELWVVTAGAGAGNPAGRVDPDKAALTGLLRTVAKEHGSWSCHALDLPWDPASAPARADWIFAALTLATAPLELAWRSGVWQEPRIEAAGEIVPDGEAPIRPDGVYLVTGGQGALGLECARALAEEAARRGGSPALVLLNRSPLPAEDAWEAWLGCHPADDPVSLRLRAVRGLRDAGARVWPVAGDVANAESMRRLVAAIAERYGGLHGVLHAAGVVRDEMLRTKSEDSFQAVLAPKVLGAWILDRVTRDCDLDFFALFSSLVARVGNPGQGDYAAANAYLDAVALERRRRGLPAVSLGWGPWGEVGMAARAKIDVRAFGLEPISPALGRRLFLAALARPADHWLLFGTTKRTAPTVPAPAVRPVEPGGDGRALGSQVRAFLAAQLAKALGLPAAEIDPQTNFMELGLDSLMAVRIKREIEESAGLSLDPTLLFEHPSLEELAAHLVAAHGEAFQRLLGERPAPAAPPVVATGRPEPALAAAAGAVGDNDVAIIGLGCRLPGAATPDELWELLRTGVDVITEVPAQRWSWRGFYDPEGRPGTTRSRWGGFLAGVDEFDPLFFGISPREAAYLDPQQRLFLEVVWETLERAGYTPDQLAAQRTGVFVGIATNEYAQTLTAAGQLPEAHAGSGNVLCMVPNRVSYLFDWNGPSLALDTACSASLAAVHLACRSLADGEADLAVVGGTNLILSPNPHIVFSRAGMLSPDGRCHTFDDSANGYVRGEGVMAVLLKPLARAMADGDEVWAVLKGTAMNHDGHSKVGLTAPNPKAQKEVISAALARAGVAPSAVGFIEAHGTGTAMGDPIEIRGLTEAFRADTDRCGFCAVGSIKSNLGHLEPAAGLAGLLRAVLALKHRQLPPTLHVRRPNRSILFEETPFFLNDRLRPWESPAGPRIAGVSSFGFGGVNVHAVLAEAPRRSETRPAADRDVEVLALSARSEAALEKLAASYLEALDGDRGADPRDVCFTANTGRRHFAHRLAIVFDGDRRELREELALAASLREGDLRHPGSRIFRGLAGAEPPPGSGGWEGLRGGLTSCEPAAAALLRRSCSGGLWEEQLLAALPPAAGAAETSLAAGSPLWPALLATLAALYAAGVEVDWAEVDRGFVRRRVVLPTYPFERQVYWPTRSGEKLQEEEAPAPLAFPASSSPTDGIGNGDGHRPHPAEFPASPLEIEQVRRRLETYLRERLGQALGVAPASLEVGRNLSDLGLESVATMELLAAVKKDFALTVYPGEVLERPTIRELAAYLAEELRAQEKLAAGAAAGPAPAAPAVRVEPGRAAAPQNGDAPAGVVFLLSSPRSGSTLLRVMLAGHPQLFCPPELHLLPFRTLGERQARLHGTYLGEGLERALMELRGVDSAVARRQTQELVDRDAGVDEVYALLARLAGPRLLVDKSPSYAAESAILARAEELFVAPRYLCLVRHPYAAIESFLRLRMHKLLGADAADPRVIAEETWTSSNRHILDLLVGAAADRCHLVTYEKLVQDPAAVLGEVCEFLGMPFHPAVLKPYEGQRMTDGVDAASLGIGDPNFLDHSGIDASLAESWKRIELSPPLGAAACAVARELGYPLREEGESQSVRRLRAERSPLVPIQPAGEASPLFCFHPSGGQVFAYQPLAAALGAGQPVYALQSPALEDPERERGSLPEMALDYVAALRAHSPQGPYRLLGWSMGGHLAMVAAQLLEQEGEEVELVGILDSRYPVSPSQSGADPLQGLACAFGGAIGAAMASLAPEERVSLRDELTGRSPEDRLRRAIHWARERGALPCGLPEDELVRQAALVERHVQLLERYRPRPIQAPIRVWWAREELATRPRTDWGRFTSGEVSYALVQGTHFTMVQQPGIGQIGKELRQQLKQLDARRRELAVPVPAADRFLLAGGVA
jgi:amino acid adenylation domain-containing protein